MAFMPWEKFYLTLRSWYQQYPRNEIAYNLLQLTVRFIGGYGLHCNFLSTKTYSARPTFSLWLAQENKTKESPKQFELWSEASRDGKMWGCRFHKHRTGLRHFDNGNSSHFFTTLHKVLRDLLCYLALFISRQHIALWFSIVHIYTWYCSLPHNYFHNDSHKKWCKPCPVCKIALERIEKLV